MARVEKSRSFPLPAGQMWERIGDFQGIDGWHPGIAAAASLNEGRTRELTLADGGKVVESIVEQGDGSYTYRIDESPLPLSGYVSTLSVEEADDGCVVTWAGEFEPHEGADDQAIGIVEAVYGSGLEAIQA